ncbi:diguanylate cyclase [Mycobacterium sp. shizuoka-1]|uniref:sensor domain-containing diguanylate cyclase n=1 Tax=Mycobacterium sp. shizuoka-1 TaxID=2039281 RepID=UPI000C06B18F|nr:diguanylate cyclase [Mycobacterium sp. shizuoka-1]
MHSFALPPFVGTLTIDRDAVVVAVDSAGRRVLGVSDQAPVAGSPVEAILAPHLAELIRSYLDTGGPHGAVFDAECLQVVVRAADDPGLYTITVENIEARQAAWHRLHLTQTTIDRITDMIIWLDRDGRYVYVNPAATALLGYSAEELAGMRVVDIDPLFDEQRWREHWQEIVERKSFTIETVNTTKAGVELPIEVTVNYVEHDGAQYNCSIVRDISERKLVESRLLELNEKITRLSITDDLTGIANRRHFDALMAEQIEAHTASGQSLSVVMLDVDHFKAFNDQYGHARGDDCLRSVAAVVQRIVAESGGIAARYGGEEFICLLPAADEAAAHAVAAGIVDSVAALAIPHRTSGVADVVTVSIGVLTARNPFDAGDILATVDARLYRAKREGRNRMVLGGG